MLLWRHVNARGREESNVLRTLPLSILSTVYKNDLPFKMRTELKLGYLPVYPLCGTKNTNDFKTFPPHIRSVSGPGRLLNTIVA